MASVGSKRARTAATPLGSGKGFLRHYGKCKYPNLARAALHLLSAHSTSLSATGRIGRVYTSARTCTVLGVERTKKLIMCCFNDRCRVADQNDFHLLLKQCRTCLLIRAMRRQKRLLLVCMRLQSKRQLQRQAALLWPEEETRRHWQSLQSKRVMLIGSGSCTVLAVCLVYSGATHACSCAFIYSAMHCD
jgi:hypothetical protein